MCSMGGDGSDGRLPYPRSTIRGVPCKDITFKLVEGDFKVRRIWKMRAHMHVQQMQAHFG